MDRSRQYYYAALILGLLFHGTLLSFTHGNTYDAYVHMFFADHYATNWFETWNYKWYTGFTMTSYPPLVHQIIALLSKVVGLKMGFIIWALVAIMLFIRGVFNFSKIWVSSTVAGYASILAVLSSSYVEAVHLFGQLPSITGAALLLNACPELYKWIFKNQWSYFFKGVSIIACMTCAHHVTTIFGMVFFIAPVLGVAVIDRTIRAENGIENVRISHFIKEVWILKWRAILIGTIIIAITICMIFPYWYWSKTDPITQVSIPHGSRANFIENFNLGLVFFLIPWGMMLFFIPAIVQRVLKKRNIFLGLSFCLLFLLGTGGTTPLPKMMLGENAFNILTLDRFTFWASIIAIPFFASLIHSLFEGSLSNYMKEIFTNWGHKIIISFLIIGIVLVDALIINMTNFKPMQPDPIEVTPIANFMDRDGHDRWRYMTLGFGDQMAWLSANTNALSVDGNYHSARRLPELTTRAVERIENSKYLGEEGLGALRQFLTLPEKYNLKYIFNNDKYYESALYFYGWTKLQSLENNIDVWERKDIPALPSILPKKNIPTIQKVLWGTLPLSSLLIAILINFFFWEKTDYENPIITDYNSGLLSYSVYSLWFIALFIFCSLKIIEVRKGIDFQSDPQLLLEEYFHDLDFNYYEKAYELLEPKSRLSIEQFMLELSLEDGLLASYAKLDSIEIMDLTSINEKTSRAKVNAHWYTAVQKYQTNHLFTLVLENNKWFIKKENFEKDIPPDQLLRIPDINFLNQGRRQAIAGKTAKEDILDRPEIYINEANLVWRDSIPYIVGELTNIDIDPSYVNVQAILFDSLGNEIISYNTNESIIHNLLPKESSYFKISFKEVVEQYELSDVENKISSFAVFVNSVVTDEKLYKFFGLKDLEINENSIKGFVLNYGNKEITIPQVNIAYVQNDYIKWVQTSYVDKGIRPQREKPFEITTEDLNAIKLFEKGTDANLLINGVSRNEYEYAQNRNLGPVLNLDSLKLFLQVNAFVSNAE